MTEVIVSSGLALRNCNLLLGLGLTIGFCLECVIILKIIFVFESISVSIAPLLLITIIKGCTQANTIVAQSLEMLNSLGLVKLQLVAGCLFIVRGIVFFRSFVSYTGTFSRDNVELRATSWSSEPWSSESNAIEKVFSVGRNLVSTTDSSTL